jgi:hypothetical protein
MADLTSLTRVDPGLYEAYLQGKYYEVRRELDRVPTGQSARGRQVPVWRAYREGERLAEGGTYRAAKLAVLADAAG